MQYLENKLFELGNYSNILRTSIRISETDFKSLSSLLNYSSNVMASFGHTSTQVPHSVHSSAFTLAWSFNVIASTGHSSTQVPHASHFSLSTTAGMFLPPMVVAGKYYLFIISISLQFSNITSNVQV